MQAHGTARLTKEPELIHTPNGIAILNFDVAWNTRFGDQQKSHFVRCVAAGKSAENIAKFFKKGDLIEIKSGELQQKSWETQDGQKRSRLEIFVEKWGFCGGNNNNKDKNDNMDIPPSDSISDDDLPF